MLTHEALPDERQQYICTLLATTGKVLAADLSKKFGVSEHTIRRDLADLAKAGVCRRVYGGAVSLAPSGGNLLQRTSEQTDRKDALAQTALRLLTANQCIFLDAGSTNMAIARAIGRDIPLTIVTNSPTIATVLLDKDNITLITLGGQVDREIGGTIGILAVEAINRLTFDLAFLGACGIDAQEGLTVFSLEDASFKRSILARSGAIAVAILNEKLLSVARHKVATLDAISTLIVENDAPQSRLQPILDRGSNIISG